jgi:hypothetical protein
MLTFDVLLVAQKHSILVNLRWLCGEVSKLCGTYHNRKRVKKQGAVSVDDGSSKKRKSIAKSRPASKKRRNDHEESSEESEQDEVEESDDEGMSSIDTPLSDSEEAAREAEIMQNDIGVESDSAENTAPSVPKKQSRPSHKHTSPNDASSKHSPTVDEDEDQDQDDHMLDEDENRNEHESGEGRSDENPEDQAEEKDENQLADEPEESFEKVPTAVYNQALGDWATVSTRELDIAYMYIYVYINN